MQQLLQQDPFFRILFDTLPVWAYVMDPECRINAVNKAACDFIGCTQGESYLHRCGTMLDCIHHTDDPRGCGFSPYCNSCIIRSTSLEAIKGKETRRTKGEIEFASGQVKYVLVSSAPFEYKEKKLAVTIIEDVSLVVELKGLLPICASCKKIRDDQGYWNHVEQYIEEHSEAEFTHDICPSCTEKLYPGLNLGVRETKIG
ncbi:PAS domain-containing protein [Desulfitobacterium metallireducens]|uniref:Histidine kinase n=1 Tax=Desulfitobacterium metallireducens DSM 15288 TaxID=871968 RepID=W0EB25_9FIRM|nr:PAS domain-containing protein [Desulfitobacterium metallireducens]AHF06424.1 histidine kinase [Desulfitobacterium metallireducens DSM 15288]